MKAKTHLVQTRVSNGFQQDWTVLSHVSKEQKFLPGTKGQLDKVKIFFFQDGLGKDFDILPQDGPGRDGISTFCHRQARTDRDGILSACLS